MTGARGKLPSIPGGGKEELRASMLKPYLLRLREQRGDKTARALLSTVNLSTTVLDDETEWISVAAARRALRALATTLGEDAIRTRGEWMTHPETLGSYVNLLRASSAPLDAYRYLAEHASETTRVGTYQLTEQGSREALVTYTPRPEAESPQADPLLCAARQAELAAIPRLWGLEDATVEATSCLANGDSTCTYRVRWTPAGGGSQLPMTTALGAVVCGGSVAFGGSWVATLIGVAVGGGLGAVIGRLMDRVRRERSTHVFEKNRIAALERGLDLRGMTHALTGGGLIGSVLGGKYRILRKIGAGGIGAVYAAEHVALGSQVAIKVLRGAAALDAAEIARLRREAQVQVSIEHPNVVRTIDLDQMPDGSIYVVMELLRGQSLAEILKRQRRISSDEAVRWFSQVCGGLYAAHRLGVVHRDLKPGNVFICDDDTVKVLDFGMSKLASAEALTEEGYTLGTPEYMSPEQCVGAPVEARSDLYALGVLMYEALTGDIPIQARTRRELLELHQRAIPMSMRERYPSLRIPEALDQAVMRCLRKRAAERPANARELQDLLKQVPEQRSERPIDSDLGDPGSGAPSSSDPDSSNPGSSDPSSSDPEKPAAAPPDSA
ncbi:MAG: serine/threonine protein kinase [Polyangiaceae bacterium]|nr:serine/threonine protein kinase [Polyangiaceae bacterium]MCW5792258.1 serine/threonine protein kinase [Polyangiaceae bacterium]